MVFGVFEVEVGVEGVGVIGENDDGCCCVVFEVVCGCCELV